MATKLRFSEHNAKEKYLFLLALSNVSNFDAVKVVRLSEHNAKEKHFFYIAPENFY